MIIEKKIRDYQQKCHREYKSKIKLLPEKYTFPDGNHIVPLPPIRTDVRGLMIVGAYPSARFEYRLSSTLPRRYRLIPIANNLQPFGPEQYFDGLRVRDLESAEGLQKYLLSKLNAQPGRYWITDLVKVFLYKRDHKLSCQAVHPGFKVPVLRHRYYDIGEQSLKYLRKECELCRPKLVVTLGEEVAQVVLGRKGASADELLVPQVARPENIGGCPTLCLPHPDACRRSDKWRKAMQKGIAVINSIPVESA